MKMLSKRRLITSIKYARAYIAQTKSYEENNSRKTKALKVIINYTESVNLDSKSRNAIPDRYFTRRASHLITRLCLVDKNVATSVAEHVFPELICNENQLVCDTNAGLGLITEELLKKGVKHVRLYEWSANFREHLKELQEKFPNKIELFNYNLYNLDTEWKEKNDRIKTLLQDLPRKAWDDKPCITIVGPMSNLYFIKYLLNALNNSHEIISFGRFQIFAFITPKEYSKCIATTENAKNYKKFTIAFQNFFDYKLLEKYPRKSFIPWDRKSSQVDADSANDEVKYIYLVSMTLKKELPVPQENVSHFITFIEYCMKNKLAVIPFLEESFPGIGVNLIVPESKNPKVHFQNMSIFTEFHELLPPHWQQVFLQMVKRPEFHDFVSLIAIQNKLNEENKKKKKNSIQDEKMEN